MKFYSGPQESGFEIFRCMFLNDKLCLLSYNALGKDEGRKLPQLIFNNFDEVDNRTTFYYPLWEYFNRLWNETEPWQPHEFWKR